MDTVNGTIEKDEREGRALVRRFSESIRNTSTGTEPLEVALEVHLLSEDASKRKALFERSPQSGRIFDVVKNQRDQLQACWTDFIKQLPSDQMTPKKKMWLVRSSSSTVADDYLRKLDICEPQHVKEAADSVKRSWQERDRLTDGKAQAAFHRVCAALDNHQSIFRLFPSEDKYTSIFCGSIRMLIQASVNHEQYARDLSLALDETLVSLMQDAITVRSIMDTLEMQNRVVELYARIFRLLRAAMQWFTGGKWHRMRNAFNENLYEYLQERIEDVRESAEGIFRHAAACGLAESRHQRLLGEETNAHTRAMLADIALLKSQLAEVKAISQAGYTKFEHLGSQLANQLKSSLRDHQVKKLIQRESDVHAKQVLVTEISSAVESSIGEVSEATRKAPTLRSIRTYEETVKIRRRLDRSAATFAFPKEPERQFASPEVVDALKKWALSTDCEFLWLQGLDEPTVPSELAPTARSVFSSAKALGIPTISHTCVNPDYTVTPEDVRERLGLLNLVHDVISQLLAIVPPDAGGGDGHDLSFARLSQLDRSLESWTLALSVLFDLLSLAPPLLFCLIDGLNILDHGKAATFVDQLLGCLYKPFGTPNKIFKLLFTTSGSSATLCEQVPLKYRMLVQADKRRTESEWIDGDVPISF